MNLNCHATKREINAWLDSPEVMKSVKKEKEIFFFLIVQSLFTCKQYLDFKYCEETAFHELQLFKMLEMIEGEVESEVW